MIRLKTYMLMSSFFPLIIAQYASAQMSSVQDKLFKLAPHKNVCPNTYRSLELNQEANKLASQGVVDDLITRGRESMIFRAIRTKQFSPTESHVKTAGVWYGNIIRMDIAT